MELSYQKLWVLLAKNNMKKTDLKDKAGITSTTLARLGKNEPVSMEALWRICEAMNCRIEDIVEFVK